MLYKTQPQNFNPKFEVVSCFCEYEGEILLLQRQETKPQGKSWGVPAGKKDATDKTLEAAMQRELEEETDIKVDKSKLNYFGQFFVRYADYDFIYHIFHFALQQKPEVVIREKEHKQFKWISPKSALHMDLIQDLDKCIKMFYNSNGVV